MTKQNIYAELGLPDSAAMQYKADLAIAIIQAIRTRGWNQTQAAEFMGVKQPVVSNIVRGKFREMSSDLLMGYLEKLEPGFRGVVAFDNESKGRRRAAAG